MQDQTQMYNFREDFVIIGERLLLGKFDFDFQIWNSSKKKKMVFGEVQFQWKSIYFHISGKQS